MKFKNDQAIYLQIAQRMIERVLRQQWKPNERIPSVRDTAVQMEVNPNTVIRSYAHLQELGIIYNQRGIGYFVSEDALERATEVRKQTFLKESLPELFQTMELLNVSIEELQTLYEQRTHVTKP